ncbi:type VII secretion target [Kitasatospora sp. NPDC047058]|uniref:type VII secretion target n=1 Tax=Kitasatospora sp. NPDC047058 TaxID=3155620 RepID=UPI0033FBCD00
MSGYISEPERLPVQAGRLDEAARKLTTANTGFGESDATARRHADWRVGGSLGGCATRWEAETKRTIEAMRQLAQGLRVTADNYNRQEDAVADGLRRAATLLEGNG